jgi:hypothetical protein
MLHEASLAGRARDLVRSLFILFHSMGDAHGISADVTFEPDQAPCAPWDFAAGREVIARAREGAAAAADRAERKWDALRRPRSRGRS